MINKKQAIEWIKSIKDGCGINNNKIPFKLRDPDAQQFWDRPIFSLGMEYGYILCLIDLFEITVEDLRNVYE